MLRKFKGFSSEFLTVRQTIRKDSRLLHPLSDLGLYGQEVGTERSGVRRACLFTSE